MVTDIFGALLQEIGALLGIKELQPDKNSSCLIKFPSGVTVQLELDRSGNFFSMGFDLGHVPPGRYRENIFREALKSNGMTPPRLGDFSFSKQADRLLLTHQLPIKELNGEKVAMVLVPLLEKARAWQEAINRGEIPTTLPGAYASKGGSGMFGLK